MCLSSILSLFGCDGSTKSADKTLQYPPFAIQKTSVVDRQYKPNEGHVSKMTYTKYNVLFHDQPIIFPDALAANTGLPGIWKTYYLKDAPKPTLLVASKNVYLVNEENNEAKLQPIESNYSNYASIQWLDAVHGQPGPKTQILIGEDTTDCILQGGGFLLVNETTVIRIADLMTFHFMPNEDMSEGYSTNQVIAFSPDHRHIVFMGSKSNASNPTQFIHALIVYDYQSHAVYTLPFDQTKTRLHSPYQADVTWLETYFEWVQSDSGKFRLSAKEIAQPLAWEGYFTKSGDYELAPVKKEMHATFVRYMIGYLQLTESDVHAEAYGNLEKYTLQYQGTALVISYLKDLNTVSLSSSFLNKETEEAQVLIQKIGRAFNDELRKGRYQLLFSSY